MLIQKLIKIKNKTKLDLEIVNSEVASTLERKIAVLKTILKHIKYKPELQLTKSMIEFLEQNGYRNL
jgi:sensor domain CHASE-containing protein